MSLRTSVTTPLLSWTRADSVDSKAIFTWLRTNSCVVISKRSLMLPCDLVIQDAVAAVICVSSKLLVKIGFSVVCSGHGFSGTESGWLIPLVGAGTPTRRTLVTYGRMGRSLDISGNSTTRLGRTLTSGRTFIRTLRPAQCAYQAMDMGICVSAPPCVSSGDTTGNRARARHLTSTLGTAQRPMGQRREWKMR